MEKIKGTAVDPAGHLKISVSNFKKSAAFYNGLFRKMGFRQVSYGRTTNGWITKEGFGIWITAAKAKTPRHKFLAPGIHHLCLKARSMAEVDSVYKSLGKDIKVFDRPQSYPEYTKKYYAVFFADPDGIKIEVAYY